MQRMHRIGTQLGRGTAVALALALGVAGSQAAGAATQCEVVDFNELSHGDAIDSLLLFDGTLSLSVEALRNEPAATVSATAYDTELWDALGNPPPNNSHDDTQRAILCNAATNGGLGECDGVVMMIPDTDFLENGDDTQGGFITITGFAGDFEIPSYAAVDSDNTGRDIILRVGADLVQVGTSTGQGNGTVETVETIPHTFTDQAQFEYEGSGGIDDIEICRMDEGGIGCRFTGGLNDTFATDVGENRYTAGGQTGANTALPPQPKGEWTHTNHSGPAGRFTFRGGTASAPEGTEIDEIRCSDPDTCTPSGNPPSPLRQLDFDGVGTFKNIGDKSATPDFVTAGANVTAEGNGNRDFDGTFHYFEVNIDDLGEPGNSNPKKNPDDSDPELCPPTGFGEKGAQELANCGCSDFYRITIYDGVDAADVVKNVDGSIDLDQLNRTDVIYEVYGYIEGGNLQIHDLTGFDRNQLTELEAD